MCSSFSKYEVIQLNDHGIIVLENITKCYVDDIPVIEDLSLAIQEGEFLTLLGPSGCGKTTILRMIGGFDRPTEGHIYLEGKEISDVPPNLRPVNTVFQKYALFPFLNVYDNIAFGLKQKGLPKDEIRTKVEKVLDIVDLEGFDKRKINTLSGGQQQRVAVARAIVNEPRILLLDEPLGALDYKMRQEMQLELRAMHEKLGITFVYVTHDQEEALTMSDRIVVLADGIIQQADTPEMIYRKPTNIFVADFIGVSNIFNGFITKEGEATFLNHPFKCESDLPLGSKIMAMIRPENVKLLPKGEGQISGKIDEAVFKGDCYEVTVVSGKNEIVAYEHKPMFRNTQVDIELSPESIHIMPFDTSTNRFEGVIDDKYEIVLEDVTFRPDISRLVVGAVFDGSIWKGADKKPVDLAGRKVSVYFDPSDAQLSDDEGAGIVDGNIASIIYVGDHYVYIVRSDNDWDYYVDDEWLWNVGDRVSVIVPEESIRYRLV